MLASVEQLFKTLTLDIETRTFLVLRFSRLEFNVQLLAAAENLQVGGDIFLGYCTT